MLLLKYFYYPGVHLSGKKKVQISTSVSVTVVPNLDPVGEIWMCSKMTSCFYFLLFPFCCLEVDPGLLGVCSFLFPQSVSVQCYIVNQDVKLPWSMSLAYPWSPAFNHGYSKLTGMQLLMSHLRAMLTKKVLHSWRNRLITLLQIILPVVCSVFALSVDFVPPEEDQVTLYFNLNPFGRTFIPFSNGSRYVREMMILVS